MTMRIHIKNLRLMTIIGVHEQERSGKQDVVINIEMEFDGAKAAESDDIKDTLDYEAAKKRIVEEVEDSSFYLLEKLASRILELVMEDPLVLKAVVEVDKPHALSLADSVSVTCSAER